MICKIYTAVDLPEHERIWIAHRLSRAGSDFHGKLVYWTYGRGVAAAADGSIAVVYDHGEIIGWARSETWKDRDTLEAFVLPAYRGRGIAAFAASGLAAAKLHDNGMGVAVFSPAMILVARRAGLHPELFERVDGEWRKA